MSLAFAARPSALSWLPPGRSLHRWASAQPRHSVQHCDRCCVTLSIRQVWDFYGRWIKKRTQVEDVDSCWWSICICIIPIISIIDLSFPKIYSSLCLLWNHKMLLMVYRKPRAVAATKGRPGLLQGWHGEALPGVTEGNSSSSARHDVGIHGLVTKNGNHRQRNSWTQHLLNNICRTSNGYEWHGYT